jgi:hypothetical protein
MIRPLKRGKRTSPNAVQMSQNDPKRTLQRGLFVEMERLRIELRSESLNPLFGDPELNVCPTAKSSQYRPLICGSLCSGVAPHTCDR